MSYDLAVLSTDKPMTKAQAIAVFRCISEEQEIGDWLVDHESVRRFVTDLAADYPQIDDLPEEKLDDCPWSCGFDWGTRWVIMSMVWSRCQEMAKIIFQLSRQHGLALFDPQTELVYLPDDVVQTAGVTLTCPWLFGPMPASRNLIVDLVPFLAKRDDPFIVLEADDDVYMQTLWTEGGYLLEYRAGSARAHFRAIANLSVESAVETLTDYALRGNRWKKMHKYSKVEF